MLVVMMQGRRYRCGYLEGGGRGAAREMVTMRRRRRRMIVVMIMTLGHASGNSLAGARRFQRRPWWSTDRRWR